MGVKGWDGKGLARKKPTDGRPLFKDTATFLMERELREHEDDFPAIPF